MKHFNLCTIVCIIHISSINAMDLINATVNCDQATIASLIKNGADVNYRAGDGLTPLHIATEYGNEQLASTLLCSNKIQVNAQDCRGWTPLHVAVLYGFAEICRLLLSRGADANKPDYLGCSPLFYAVFPSPAAINSMRMRPLRMQNVQSAFQYTTIQIMLHEWQQKQRKTNNNL